MDWKFWKSNDSLGDADDVLSDLDFGDSSGMSDSSQGPMGDSSQPDFSSSYSPPPSEPQYSSAPMSQQQPQSQPMNNSTRDLQSELVLSKLDAIKNQLENVSARLDRLEQVSRQQQESDSSQQQSQRGPWYAQR